MLMSQSCKYNIKKNYLADAILAIGTRKGEQETKSKPIFLQKSMD